MRLFLMFELRKISYFIESTRSHLQTTSIGNFSEICRKITTSHSFGKLMKTLSNLLPIKLMDMFKVYFIPIYFILYTSS